MHDSHDGGTCPAKDRARHASDISAPSRAIVEYAQAPEFLLGCFLFSVKAGDRIALTPCPRCGKLIPVGSHYCAECKPIMQKAAEDARTRKRAARAKQYRIDHPRKDDRCAAFYRGSDWKRTSRAKLNAASYRCEARIDSGCAGIACEVHHIQPIQTPEGWERRLEWNNLEAVCTHCHNLRHAGRFKRKPEPGVLDLNTLGGG